MSGACFICDQPADAALVVIRFDGTAYEVPMCSACLAETKLRAQPIRLAHELIDARNDYRTQRRRMAA